MPSRRNVLKAATLPLLAAGCRARNGGDPADTSTTSTAPAPLPPNDAAPPPDRYAPTPFSLGIASGIHPDSTSSIILWTRPDPRLVTAETVDIEWIVASDPMANDVVATATVTTSADRDWCATTVVDGLVAGRSWWYRASWDGWTSPIGRAATRPDTDAEPTRLRLLAGSCQGWGSGYFTMWDWAATEDVDAIVHLGDYIYESGWGGPRGDEEFGAVNLATYRAKYRQCRSDPAMQRVHQAHPFLFTWDDHEFVNDFAATDREIDPIRFDAARRAWHEYLPVLGDTRGATDTIERQVRWGNLAELFLLDTRTLRDGRVEPPGRRRIDADFDDPDRTMLGTAQREWLLDGLAASSATWTVLGTSVPLLPDRIEPVDSRPRSRSYDTWDGFPAERRMITEALRGNERTGVVALSGDRHVFLAGVLGEDPDDPESAPVLTELCGSGISSGVPELDPVPRAPITSYHRANGLTDITFTPSGAEGRFVGCTAIDPTSTPTEIERFAISP